MLGVVLSWIQMTQGAHKVVVPNHSGLEFGLIVNYASENTKGGGSMYIGCIQRTKGAEFEFHS